MTPDGISALLLFLMGMSGGAILTAVVGYTMLEKEAEGMRMKYRKLHDDLIEEVSTMKNEMNEAGYAPCGCSLLSPYVIITHKTDAERYEGKHVITCHRHQKMWDQKYEVLAF